MSGRTEFPSPQASLVRAKIRLGKQKEHFAHCIPWSSIRRLVQILCLPFALLLLFTSRRAVLSEISRSLATIFTGHSRPKETCHHIPDNTRISREVMLNVVSLECRSFIARLFVEELDQGIFWLMLLPPGRKQQQQHLEGNARENVISARRFSFLRLWGLRSLVTRFTYAVQFWKINSSYRLFLKNRFC